MWLTLFDQVERTILHTSTKSGKTSGTALDDFYPHSLNLV